MTQRVTVICGGASFSRIRVTLYLIMSITVYRLYRHTIHVNISHVDSAYLTNYYYPIWHDMLQFLPYKTFGSWVCYLLHIMHHAAKCCLSYKDKDIKVSLGQFTFISFPMLGWKGARVEISLFQDPRFSQHCLSNYKTIKEHLLAIA